MIMMMMVLMIEIDSFFFRDVLVEKVDNHIKSINFAYRVSMRSNKINYINGKARFHDKNTLAYENRAGETVCETLFSLSFRSTFFFLLLF